MRILVTGCEGQLGKELISRCAQKGHSVVAYSHEGLDITRRSTVLQTFAKTAAPAVVVNAAAFTAVDRAERESEAAFSVNRDGAAHIAEACERRGAALIHVSTDYVFDGEKKGPYSETDTPRPINTYGRSKLAGEEAVRERQPRHIIVRTSWLFGLHGSNFVRTMLRLARQHRSLSVVTDQRGCPTAASGLASTIVDIAERVAPAESNLWGVYHFCGSPPTTRYAFAEEIFREAARLEQPAPEELVPVTSARFPTTARRPSQSVLDCRKIRQVFGIAQPAWRDGLKTAIVSES